MKLSPFKVLYSIPLLVLFCSSCEDKVKISENEALKATIAEMEIELKDVKDNMIEDPGSQGHILKQAEEDLILVNEELDTLKDEKEALEKIHSERKSVLDQYKKTYPIK